MKTPHSHMAPGTEGLAGIWVEGRCSLHGPRAPPGRWSHTPHTFRWRGDPMSNTEGEESLTS